VNTKDKILLKSLELFNKKGVENSTTLLISKEMKISLGNLHYHFPNRNALIEQLVDKFLLDLEELNIRLKTINNSNLLEHYVWIHIETYRIIWKYRFIFNDRLVIQRRTDYLDKYFKQMIAMRKEAYISESKQMDTVNVLNDKMSEKTLQAHFIQMVINHNSWVSYTDLFDVEGEPALFFAIQSIWHWKLTTNFRDEELEKAILAVTSRLSKSSSN
jgi:AcrR family transcriptional regulator